MICRRFNIEPTAAVLAAAVFLALAVVPFLADAAEAETAFDEDLGDFNSLGITVRYAPPSGGDPAESVTWDFGDGSPAETRGPFESVRHVYAAAGVYYITQTATNSVGSSTAVYKVDMLGYPAVTFVVGHGHENIVVQQTAYNVPVTAPEVPSVDGHVFRGWYSDEACTVQYNMTAGVTAPITLYAKWTAEGEMPGTVTVTFKGADGTVVLTKEIAAGGSISALDLAKELAKDGRIYAGVYTDAELQTAFDTSAAIGSDLTLYVKYTDVVPAADDLRGWTVVGAFAAGIVCLIAFAAVRNPAPAVIGAVLIVAAALLHFGVV